LTQCYVENTRRQRVHARFNLQLIRPFKNVDQPMEGNTSPAIEASPLPSDSVARVMEMCKLRRERQVAEHQVWEQDSRVRQEHEKFVSELTGALEDDELAARSIVAKTEQRAFGRIHENAENAASTLRSTMTSEESQRKIALQRQLQRAAFRHFWNQHTSTVPVTSSGSCDADVQARRDAVSVLRRSYAHSAPIFASDPEDLWRRGIAVAPDLQQAACEDPEVQALRLPAYHEFAMTLRSRYARDRGGI
jgi:hypothetical protein